MGHKEYTIPSLKTVKLRVHCKNIQGNTSKTDLNFLEKMQIFYYFVLKTNNFCERIQLNETLKKE